MEKTTPGRLDGAPVRKSGQHTATAPQHVQTPRGHGLQPISNPLTNLLPQGPEWGFTYLLTEPEQSWSESPCPPSPLYLLSKGGQVLWTPITQHHPFSLLSILPSIINQQIKGSHCSSVLPRGKGMWKPRSLRKPVRKTLENNCKAASGRASQ